MENKLSPKESQIEINVDRYVRLARQQAEISAEMDSLKGYFEAQGTEDLKNTKEKTIEYWGGCGKVEVGTSEKVTLISETVFKKLLKDVFNDLFKERSGYDMTSSCKQILAAIAQGNYIDTPLDEIIRQASDDPKIQATLRKRLRGDFKRDKKALLKVAGLSEQDAEYYAYMSVEAVAYGRFRQLLSAAGYEGSFEDARDAVRAGIIMEDGVKVTVDAPKRV